MDSRNDPTESIIRDPNISFDRVLEYYPPGISFVETENINTVLKCFKSEDPNTLAGGWDSSPYGQGFDLKLANIDSIIDLTGGLTWGRISTCTPVEPNYSFKILNLGYFLDGKDYWSARAPNSEIYSLYNDHNKSKDLLSVADNIESNILKAYSGLAELIISSVHINSEQELRTIIFLTISCLRPGGSIIIRIDGSSIPYIGYALTMLSSIFNQVGISRLFCSPQYEAFIWAKKRAGDEYLTAARTWENTKWPVYPTEEQINYLNRFINQWRNSSSNFSTIDTQAAAKNLWCAYN